MNVMLRRPLLAIVVASVALGLAAPAAPAASSWCSESGDQCWGTFKRDGKRYVGVTYAAQYKTRERLCVRSPKGQRDCVKRKLRRGKSGTYTLNVRWSTTFPNRGKGTYEFESPGDEKITFRIR